MMVVDKALLGRVSLWSAILGLILPGCSLAVLSLVMDIHSLEFFVFAMTISGFLFCTFELVALGCGIAARRTAAGKAGLAVVAGIAILVLLSYLMVWIRESGKMPPAPPGGHKQGLPERTQGYVQGSLV
jgi:uncharacterized membrane protein